MFIEVVLWSFIEMTPPGGRIQDEIIYQVLKPLERVGQLERANDRNSTNAFKEYQALQQNSCSPRLGNQGSQTPQARPSDPPRADITRLIADVKAAEQQYFDNGGLTDNQAVLDAWREHTRGVSNNPALYATRTRAEIEAKKQIKEFGPYEVVYVAASVPLRQTLIQRGINKLAIRTGYSGSRQNIVNSASSREDSPQERNDLNSSGVQPAGLTQNDSKGPVDPVEEANQPENQPGELDARDWFDTVFVPEAELQYAAKWQVRSLNQPWDGRVFLNEDAGTPGSTGQVREALREWLVAVARPRFEAEVRRMR